MWRTCEHFPALQNLQHGCIQSHGLSCSQKYNLFYLLIYLLICISLHRYLTSTEADDALPQEKRMRIFFHVFAGLPVSIKLTSFFNSLLSVVLRRVINFSYFFYPCFLCKRHHVLVFLATKNNLSLKCSL